MAPKSIYLMDPNVLQRTLCSSPHLAAGKQSKVSHGFECYLARGAPKFTSGPGQKHNVAECFLRFDRACGCQVHVSGRGQKQSPMFYGGS